MTWSLYDKGKFLQPLKFSNGKTQEDIVKEVLNLIEKGKKIIFIHGVCGTGKSAIALNIANKLGKSSIVVPGKNLQAQYKRDYEEEKYLLKKNGEKLKISVITGRNNHTCKFLEDNHFTTPKIKREINSRLNDIFSGYLHQKKEDEKDDLSAANPELPCNIEIRERNWLKIKKYIEQNKKVNVRNFSSIKDAKRMSIGPACPYWSPVLPEKYEVKTFPESRKRKYEGLDGNIFIQYKGLPGCPFYEQFNSYMDSDVIVFNSLKYKLETALLRKPKTEIEIIDECDEFLDSFSNERVINIDRLQNSLVQTLGSGEGDEEMIEELFKLINHLNRDERVSNSIKNGEILPLKSTGVYDIIKLFLKEEWLKSIDDESYLFDVLETSKMFLGFLEESYVIFSKKEKGFFVEIVTTNLAKKLNQLVEKNKVLVFMSGTLHSKEVLKDIFGIQNFEKVDAETESQGIVEIKKTGLEIDCKYSNFSSEKFTREDYLRALDQCLKTAPRPTLVHINAFMDLPSEYEIKEFEIETLPPREKIREMQIEDKRGRLTKEFKDGKKDILFSTRDSRGIDFPGKECRSIVFTKYPNPNVQDPFWKILMKTRPERYWNFYRDKARREFLQKIYRGLRFKEDHIYLLSPDTRVLEMAEKEFGGYASTNNPHF
ncbi:MAG: DEAD/DEAH box helicase family protein [Nanoarchaeota archaeon]|nr:DEAD/DEAH box helicase family protein [Nanoarchaeota archaeon]